ncbi:MAG: hypothetical protein K2P58_07730 [Hyphomonadaceae bacterium]|nr:hypothetical protein [Hyphomonadaceae bacterium]
MIFLLRANSLNIAEHGYSARRLSGPSQIFIESAAHSRCAGNGPQSLQRACWPKRREKGHCCTERLPVRKSHACPRDGNTQKRAGSHGEMTVLAIACGVVSSVAMFEITPTVTANRLEVTITGAPEAIYYEWQGPIAFPVPRTHDFALLAALAPAMRVGGDVYVHGRIDRRLLANAEKFSEIWAAWRPDLYRQIRIAAAEELEPCLPNPQAGHAFALSAGLDSVFSLMQNSAGADGRVSRRPGAAYLMNWRRKDSPDDPWFERARRQAQRIADQLGVPFFVCSTNWRSFSVNFYVDHPVGIIAAAHCLDAMAAGCVLAADAMYVDEYKLAPLGNNHTTNPLLSSSAFEVTNYGGAYRRMEKMRLLAQRPELLREVVVCHERPDDAVNCGRCEKCVRSGLELFVGTGAVEPFMRSLPSPWRVAAMKPMSESSLVFWRDMMRSWRDGRPGLRAGIGALMWRSQLQQQPFMRALKAAEIAIFRRRKAA